MIERVEEVSANLDVFRFADPEILEDRKIEIVNRRQQECVPADVGFSTGTRLNVTSIRIVCEIPHYSSDDIPVCVKGARAYSAQGLDCTADSLGSIRIENRAVTRVVSVQVRIVSAANCDPLAGFIRISSGDVEAAQKCL